MTRPPHTHTHTLIIQRSSWWKLKHMSVWTQFIGHKDTLVFDWLRPFLMWSHLRLLFPPQGSRWRSIEEQDDLRQL